MASTPAAAKAVQQALAKQGVHIEVGAAGQDLGVDFTAGGRRRISMQTCRMTRMRSGITHTLRVGKCTEGTATRRLILTGVRPRIYGFSAIGAAPTTIQTTRASIIKGLCIRKPGGCASTSLPMYGYQWKDPLVTMMVENILGYAEAVRQEGGVTAFFRRA